MKGKCNLCGKRFTLPDGPPTEDAPQYIYLPFSFEQQPAGIYKVLRYPVMFTMIVRPIFVNLELKKEMPKMDEWHGGREELICDTCVSTELELTATN